MSKIPSSYRIIKNHNVSSQKEDISVIETKIVYSKPKDSFDLLPKDETRESIDLDKVREEIRKSILSEIEEERLDIIKNANYEAEKTFVEARNKGHEEGYKQGLEDGLKKGYKQGIEDAKEEGANIKNHALFLVEQAQNHVSEYLEENRTNIINLAANMAESIVHHTIDSSTENILMLIKPIIQQCGKKENIVITCHPKNSPFLKEKLSELEDMCQDARLVLLEDGNLEKNGCIIENEHQIVDLQIKKQIENILEEIKNLE